MHGHLSGLNGRRRSVMLLVRVLFVVGLRFPMAGLLVRVVLCSGGRNLGRYVDA